MAGVEPFTSTYVHLVPGTRVLLAYCQVPGGYSTYYFIAEIRTYDTFSYLLERDQCHRDEVDADQRQREVVERGVIILKHGL